MRLYQWHGIVKEQRKSLLVLLSLFLFPARDYSDSCITVARLRRYLMQMTQAEERGRLCGWCWLTGYQATEFLKKQELYQLLKL